jgi:hypothetical protein
MRPLILVLALAIAGLSTALAVQFLESTPPETRAASLPGR